MPKITKDLPPTVGVVRRQTVKGGNTNGKIDPTKAYP